MKKQFIFLLGMVLVTVSGLFAEVVRLKTNLISDLFVIPNITAEFKMTDAFWLSTSYTSLNWGGEDQHLIDYKYTKWTIMPRYHYHLNKFTESIVGLGIGNMQAQFNTKKSQSLTVIEFFAGFDFLMTKNIVTGFGGGFMYILDPNNEEGEHSTSVDAILPIVDMHVGWRF